MFRGVPVVRINAVTLLAALTVASVFVMLATIFKLPSDPPEEEPQPIVMAGVDRGLQYTAHLPPTLSIRPFAYNVTNVPESFWMMRPPHDYRSMTCKQLYNRHLFEFDEANDLSTSHFFYTTISYHEMFRDPHPVCGRYALSHWLNEDHMFIFVLRAPLQPTDNVLQVTAGEWTEVVELEQCGACLDSTIADTCKDDVEFIARLVNENRVVGAQVVRPAFVSEAGKTDRVVSRIIRFRVPDPGDYSLEVKMVHLNVNPDVPSGPRTLGVISGWGNVSASGFFTYNSICDVQRHVYGSPLRVRVVGASPPAPPKTDLPPFCNASTNYNTTEGGQWVRFIDGADPSEPLGSPHSLAAQCMKGDRYCYGNPAMLTDRRGLNSHLVWVPRTCRLRIVSGSAGDPFPLTCRRAAMFAGKSTVVLFAGGINVKEYYNNCQALMKGSGSSTIQCLYREIIYNSSSGDAGNPLNVLSEVLDSIQHPVSVLVTNLGIEGSMETWSRKEWEETVQVFVQEWRRRKITLSRGPYTKRPVFGTGPTVSVPGEALWQQYMWDQNYRSETMESGEPQDCPFPCLEWAIWLSPPTVHYTLTGWTNNRSVEWDHLAYEQLKTIGFTRLDALTPTSPRQEGSWDGMRYMALSMYEPFSLPEPRKDVPEDSGGVSYMLFVILLNVICFS